MGRRRGKRTRRKSPAIHQQANKPVEAQAQRNNADDNGQNGQPPAIREEHPNTCIKSREPAKPKNKEHRWPSSQLILGVCDLILAIVLAAATIGLWFKAGDQIKVARDAIAEAKDANDIAREALVQGRRAYMTVKDISVSYDRKLIIDGMPSPTFVKVSWENTGQSPALNPSIIIEYHIMRFDEELPVFKPRQVSHTNGSPIGPGGVVSSSVLDFSSIGGQIIRSEEYHVILHMRADYNIMGDERRRHSEVTMIGAWGASLGDEPPNEFRLDWTPIGNQNGAN